MNTTDYPVIGAYPDRVAAPAPGWLQSLRREAAERLATDGLPAQGDEAWKYTSPRTLFCTVWTEPRPADVDLSDRWYVARGVDRLVFVDGRLDMRWSKLPAGAATLVTADGAQLDDVRGIGAFNLATATDGAILRLAEGTVVLAHVSTEGASLVSVRHRIEVERFGSATVIAVFEGAGSGLGSVVTEVVVGDGGRLVYAEAQEGAAESRHLHRIAARLGRDATFEATLVAMGGAVARTEVESDLSQGSTADLAGLTLARGTQILDFHTTTTHTQPHATSRQLFKAILDDRSRGVYTGRVVVPVDAVKSDVQQSNPTLLLSDAATANTRPQLEIRCDDVKASHGAAIGRLDAEAQFYLQARGIGARAARALLTQAFASEVVARIPHDVLRDRIDARVHRWLEGV